MIPCLLAAQTKVLSIHKKQGEVVQYPFEEQPKISYHNGNLIVKSNNVEVSYPLSNIKNHIISW